MCLKSFFTKMLIAFTLIVPCFVFTSQIGFASLNKGQNNSLTTSPDGSPNSYNGNISLGKVATQSSTDFGAFAERAVDGNTDGNWYNSSLSCTLNENNPWWKVDLGSDYKISNIVVFNRTDECGERLTNFKVSILDINENEIWSVNQLDQPSPSVCINVPGIVGRHVKIQLNQQDRLTIAEVQVFGEKSEGEKVPDYFKKQMITSEVYGDPYGNIQVCNSSIKKISDITIGSGDIIDSFAFTYKDGTQERFGGDGGSCSTIHLSDDEYIVSISGSYGSWYDGPQHIWNLKFTTNKGKIYGPFGGYNVSASSFEATVDKGDAIIGLFGNISKHNDGFEGIGSIGIVIGKVFPYVQTVSCDSCPQIPSGLKTVWNTMPILKWNNITYWAYSYIDNRVSFNIVAYDSKGNILKQWEKEGDRYITSIYIDNISRQVYFRGQYYDANLNPNGVMMSFEELFITESEYVKPNPLVGKNIKIQLTSNNLDYIYYYFNKVSDTSESGKYYLTAKADFENGEIFNIQDAGNSEVYLKAISPEGKFDGYLSVDTDNKVIINTSIIPEKAETFKLNCLEDGKFNLKSVYNGNFVCADVFSGYSVTADRGLASVWETFNAEELPDIIKIPILEVGSKDTAKIGDKIIADIVIHNAINICAEDIKINYDSNLLEYIGTVKVDGMKVYKEADLSSDTKRFITASLGKVNAANGDKTLLRLEFKAKKAGNAKIAILNGRIADNSTLETDVQANDCGEKIIKIEENYKDVNRSGTFTLLDLGIDAWYYGEPVSKTDTYKYDADVVADGFIDGSDLSTIVSYIV